MTERIQCCVPFCKRTARAKGFPGEEIICGKHWMMVSKPTRRFQKRALRKAVAFMETYPDPADVPPALQDYAIRLIKISLKAWERVKKEAIEAAGGIG